MSERAFNEAIFRLGQLASNPALTNHKLLRRLNRIITRYTGVEAAAIAVHEKGIRNPATLVHVVGPWGEDKSESFVDWASWIDSSGELAAQTASPKHNTIYTLDELMAREDYQKTKLYSDFHQPLDIVDQAFGIYRRADGCELFLAINALSETGKLSQEALDRFAQLGPYAAKAWAATWRFEPAWVIGLKPVPRAVLELVLEGLDDDQISERLDLTYHAVRAHLKRLFKASDVRSRLHLMQAYKREITGRTDGRDMATAGNQGDDVITVVDPSDTAFGMTLPTD